MEELEHALKEYNITDEKSIKEIIAEVDTDNVRYPFLYTSLYGCSIYKHLWLKYQKDNTL